MLNYGAFHVFKTFERVFELNVVVSSLWFYHLRLGHFLSDLVFEHMFARLLAGWTFVEDHHNSLI